MDFSTVWLSQGEERRQPMIKSLRLHLREQHMTLVTWLKISITIHQVFEWCYSQYTTVNTLGFHFPSLSLRSRCDKIPGNKKEKYCNTPKITTKRDITKRDSYELTFQRGQIFNKDVGVQFVKRAKCYLEHEPESSLQKLMQSTDIIALIKLSKQSLSKALLPK